MLTVPIEIRLRNSHAPLEQEGTGRKLRPEQFPPARLLYVPLTRLSPSRNHGTCRSCVFLSALSPKNCEAHLGCTWPHFGIWALFGHITMFLSVLHPYMCYLSSPISGLRRFRVLFWALRWQYSSHSSSSAPTPFGDLYFPLFENA